MTPCPSVPEDVLRDIRSQLFADSHDEPARNLRKQLQKASKLLSNDLYTTKVHFLMELIQNADDNRYAEGEVPRLQIKVDDHGITLYNNELGFEEQNVRAICAVGSSSKVKKEGFIGEKGIGFKSVFSVANKVHIYSAGYCFMFDAEGELGYIEPLLLDPQDFPVAIIHPNQGTTMYMQFRRDSKGTTEELMSELHSVQPEIMMFLLRLRCLDLELPTVRKVFTCVQGHPMGTSSSALVCPYVVQEEVHDLLSGQEPAVQESNFILVKQGGIDVPADMIGREEKRAGVATTSVALAFPVDAAGEVLICEGMQAFAFLPIVPSGLRFLIQADFILASSRETILEDRSWNKWLMQELADLVLRCQMDPGLQQLQARPLAYLPLPGEVNSPFFSRFAELLVSGFRAQACVLSEAGRWEHPEACLLPSAKWTGLDHSSPLIPGDMLSNNRSYVSNAACAQPRTVQVLAMLGCREFSADDLVSCLVQPTALEHLAGMSDAWLARLYTLLTHHHNERLPVDWAKLRNQAPIFRLPDRRMLTAASGHLKLWQAGDFDATERALFSALDFLAEGSVSPGCHSMLSSRFGVQRATVAVLTPHLLSLYAGDVQQASPQVLLEHVLFLFRHQDAIPQDVWTSVVSKRGIKLRVQGNGQRYARPHRLHLLPADTCAYLERELEATGVLFLHPQYHSAAANDVLRLEAFLHKLGVKSLTAGDIASRFKKLYDDARKPTAERNLAHLEYMCNHQSSLDRSLVQQLPDVAMVQGSGGQYMPGKDIHCLLTSVGAASALRSELQAAGMAFMHEQQYERLVAKGPMMFAFLTEFMGVVQPSIMRITDHLLHLHQSQESSAKLNVPLHLDFLAEHAYELAGNQMGERIQAALRLPCDAGKGCLAGLKDGLFAPLEGEFSSLQADMRSTGMKFLDPEVWQRLKEYKSKEVLLPLLGIRHVEAADAIDAICSLHQRGVESLLSTHTCEDMLQHLAFIYKHKSVLSRKPKTADRVRRLIWLQSSGGEWARASQLRLPLTCSPASLLQRVLQQGCGTLFWQPEAYPALATDERDKFAEARSFLRDSLGVAELREAAVASKVLQLCELQPGGGGVRLSELVDTVSDDDMLAVVRFILSITSCDESNKLMERARTHLPLRTQQLPGVPADAPATYHPPSQLYFPSVGREGDWKLVDVLPPGQVRYLHPAWAKAIERSHHIFSTLTADPPNGLGLRQVPEPDSAELMAAAATSSGSRSRALLCMLRDSCRWGQHKARLAAAAAAPLRAMRVPLKGGGEAALEDTYLPTQSIRMQLSDSVSYLDVPSPDCLSSWSWLAALGVSTEANPATLLKHLKKLSATGAGMETTAALSIYLGLSSDASQEVVQAFNTYPLIFWPAEGGAHEWLSLGGNVRWSAGGLRGLDMFRMLDKVYRGQVRFFKERLGVQDACAEDLGSALAHLSVQPPSRLTPAAALTLYSQLADVTCTEASPAPSWLSQLMQAASLLVSTADGLRFVPSTSTAHPLYLVDEPHLLSTFCTPAAAPDPSGAPGTPLPGLQLLAVERENLPGIMSLLQLCPSPPELLSTAVKIELLQAEAVEVDTKLTSLVQQAFSFCVRYWYAMQPSSQRQRAVAKLLSRGVRMHALCGEHSTGEGCTPRLQVYKATNMTSRYQLGDLRQESSAHISHRCEVGADGQESISILLDEAAFDEADDALAELVDTYAGLWPHAHEEAAQWRDHVDTVLQHLVESKERSLEKKLHKMGALKLPDEVGDVLRRIRLGPHYGAGQDSEADEAARSSLAAAQELAEAVGRTAQAERDAAAAAGSAGLNLCPVLPDQDDTTSEATILPSDGLPMSCALGLEVAAGSPQGSSNAGTPMSSSGSINTQPRQQWNMAPGGSFSEALEASRYGAASTSTGSTQHRRLTLTDASDASEAAEASVGEHWGGGLGVCGAPEASSGGEQWGGGLGACGAAQASSREQWGGGCVAAEASSSALSADGAALASVGEQWGGGGSGKPGTSVTAGEKLWTPAAHTFTPQAACEGTDESEAADACETELGLSALADALAMVQGSCEQLRSSLVARATAAVQLTHAPPTRAHYLAVGMQHLSGGVMHAVDDEGRPGHLPDSWAGQEDVALSALECAGQPFAVLAGPTDAVIATAAAANATRQEGDLEATITTVATEQLVVQWFQQHSLRVQRLVPATVHPQSTGDPLVGLLGELAAWQALQAAFPERMAPRNWVSGGRVVLGLPPPTQEPPFDLWMDDPDGRLTGRPNSVALIEVKATKSRSGASPFFISSREWDLAMHLARTATFPSTLLQLDRDLTLSVAGKAAVYVIVRVARVGKKAPVIDCVLPDPGRMYWQGLLQLHSTDRFMLEVSDKVQ